MKHVVILGAGTGGALVANLLRRKLDAREWTITVVDPAREHVYARAWAPSSTTS